MLLKSIQQLWQSTGWRLPDDGLCKPKHARAIIIVLNVFNNLTILKQTVCICWTNTGFDINNMHGSTMKPTIKLHIITTRLHEITLQLRSKIALFPCFLSQPSSFKKSQTPSFNVVMYFWSLENNIERVHSGWG